MQGGRRAGAAGSWGAELEAGMETPSSHLPTLMIHKQVPDVALSSVGDLQPMGVPYLLCLEGGIQVLDADDSFGPFTLKERKQILKMLTVSRVTAHHVPQGGLTANR